LGWLIGLTGGYLLLAAVAHLLGENLQFEQNYYKSGEYLTLEAKRRLGLAEPGEKVLILPTNSAAVKAESAANDTTSLSTADVPAPPPLQQWLDFLFGAKSKS